MYYMIDNKDSFVYNLVAYFKELGCDIVIESADRINPKELDLRGVRGIIISPGPGKPEDAVVPLQIVGDFGAQIPILGVCLGHQILAHAFGGTVCKGQRPMHGKVTPITHTGKRLFKDLPLGCSVTRYHSLVTQEDTVTDNFHIDARAEDGAVMAIAHKAYPLYGVQFHPEAILTEHGHKILQNFLDLCKDWWTTHA